MANAGVRQAPISRGSRGRALPQVARRSPRCFGTRRRSPRPDSDSRPKLLAPSTRLALISRPATSATGVDLTGRGSSGDLFDKATLIKGQCLASYGVELND